MGDDFVAPEGFDWSMTATTTVNVEADNEDPQYYSLVEVLDANPFSTSDYNVLAKGTAKPGQPFSQEVIYPQGITYLYIRKTDPRGRVSVNALTVDKQADLSARSTRTLNTSTRSSDIPEKYPEEIYDTTGAIELVGDANWNQDNHHLEGGKSYIIKDKFTGNINDNKQYSGIFTLYIESEWTPPNNMIKNANIIVLKGGKLNISSLKSFLIDENSTLTIQAGGSLIGDNLNLTTNTLMKNFGTVKVNSMKDLNSNCTLYNAPKASIVITGNSVDSQGRAVFTKGIISNFGELTIQNGILEFNSEDNMRFFYNGERAIINTPTFIIGGIGVNDGTINALKISNGNGGNPTFTNNCSMYVKETFELGSTTTKFIMNKGILAGGIEDDNFIAIPSFKCANSGITFELNNGSMIKAKVMTIPGVNIIAGTDGSRSLLKATQSISTGWTTYFKGNLDIECPEEEFAKDVPSDNPNYVIEKTVNQYTPNGSKTIIVSCGETTEVPDPGTDPKDPQFPIEMEDNHEYSYLFEDQWPLYGDYDMNDIVMTIKKRKLSTYKNKVKKFELEIELSAVGATKKIGAAIMFDGVLASDITEEVDFDNDDDNDNTLIKSFNLNNYNIENGQKYAVVPLFDDAHKTLGRNQYIQINTISGHSSNVKKTKTISFSIEFDTPTLSADAFNINKLNVFIITGGNDTNRREIHVAGYQPTQLADVNMFGGNDDDSSTSAKKYYLSKENLAWGIVVPTNFKWPSEYVNIQTAYKQFNNWVTSGGSGNKNWWNDWDETKVFQTNKN